MLEMSAVAEKTTQNMEAAMPSSEKDVQRDEVMEKASPNGSDGAAEEDEEFHFTLGKFLAIAVSITLLLPNSPFRGSRWPVLRDQQH
jgi:hypothetical protein